MKTTENVKILFRPTPLLPLPIILNLKFMERKVLQTYTLKESGVNVVKKVIIDFIPLVSAICTEKRIKQKIKVSDCHVSKEWI